VEAQHGRPESTLELYRAALDHRKSWAAGDESFEWVDAGPDTLEFRRGSGLRCVVNLGDREVALGKGEILVSSGPVSGTAIGPNTAVWLAG
jgi:alpha-glucosidase